MANRYCLILQANQVTFTGAIAGIVGLVMLELVKIKIGLQFPVNPLKQVQIKLAGITSLVIISSPYNPWMLFQVKTHQYQVPGLQMRP
jgi:hypothetical protein